MRILLPFLISFSLFGQAFDPAQHAHRGDQFIVMLSEPSAGANADFRGGSRAGLQSAGATAQRAAVSRQQATFLKALAAKGARVAGTTQDLVNAVFIDAASATEADLRAQPGVVGVFRVGPIHRALNKALDLVNASSAWATLGGSQNAGTGMKIGIIDTGIENTHPAFSEQLPTVAGYPKGPTADLPYTNRKIIAARSYVGLVAADIGTPEVSRPDDLTPRDRVGHGTAIAMIAAGKQITGPAGTIMGIAPKAYLGNYKIFGSPGVNDFTTASVVTKAIDDAFADGMDVVTLSLAFPAEWRTTDSGGTCQNAGGVACDPWSAIIRTAALGGMTVVVPAGNAGDSGLLAPALNTISTPGTNPGAITVGATTNSHELFASVFPQGASIPAELKAINARFGDGPPLAAAVTAPLKAALQGTDGTACTALPGNSLTGSIALVIQGSCDFTVKIANAQQAGAIAALIYRSAGGEFLFPMTGLAGTGIPAALIGNTAGNGLKTLLGSNSNLMVKLDPTLVEATDVTADQIAYFSSQGPSINDGEIKPDLVAPGTGLYMAGQTLDPNGDLYSSSGFVTAQGTSFAVPFVAGVVAMVKQLNPTFTPKQLKSAVVNTAGGNLFDFDSNGTLIIARIRGAGAGKLDAGNAVKATLAADPVSVSLGYLTAGVSTRFVTLTNTGKAAQNLTLTAQQRDLDSNAHVVVSPSSVQLAIGQSVQISVGLMGTLPLVGSYEGFIVVDGSSTPFRIPYMYIVPEGTPADIFTLSGNGFVRVPGDSVYMTLKSVDQLGVPTPNQRVQFNPSQNISLASDGDNLGIAFAYGTIGSQIGKQTFTAQIGSLRVSFDGQVVAVPTIQANGVQNAGSHAAVAVAPGSYIEIKGTGLSPSTRTYTTTNLPYSLAGVSVSFDIPARGISVPGRVYYVSDSQINVQVPWEVQGSTSALMKVSLGYTVQSALVTVSLAPYSPAFFEYTDAGNGRLTVAARDEAFLLISAANPVARGRVAQLYVNGLGPVDHQPASGEVSPADQLARTNLLPTVMIGGQAASVQFSGFSPGSVGLYQVNVIVPGSVNAGVQDVVLAINGQTAKTSTISVK
ncbi:MAG: S8 family serine peptidase [Bryobacteraceae bacterium]